MLLRSIAYDERLAQLSLASEYLFLKAIPHQDDGGRMVGLPSLIRGQVVPARADREQWDDDLIHSLMLEWLQTRDQYGEVRPLVRWGHGANGLLVVEFPGFEKTQRLRRRTASSLPTPEIPVADFPGGMTLFDDLRQDGNESLARARAEEKGREEKRREEKRRKEVVKATAFTPTLTPATEREVPTEEPSEVPAQAKRPDKSPVMRPRDELWDALVREVGTQPSTRSERGRWNAALRELREVGASALDVRARAQVYRQRWPEMSFTPTALSSNWGSLEPKASAAPACPECSVGAGRHAADCPTLGPMDPAVFALGLGIGRKIA